MSRLTRFFSLSLLIVLLTTFSWAQEEQPAEAGASAAATAANMPQSLDEAIVSVVIGDLPALVESFGVVSTQIMPEMTGETLKKQVGQMVGDPTLAGLPEGAGMAMVFFPGGQGFAYAEVSEEHADAYMSKLSEQGQMAEKASGLLVLADTEEGMQAATTMADQVKSGILEGETAPAAKATVYMQKIMKAFGPQVDQILKSLPMMMSGMGQQQGAQSGITRILEIEAHSLYSLANQIDVFNLQIDVPQQGIRVRSEITPVAESNLATFLSAEKPESALKLVQMLPGKGAARGAFAFNIDAYGDLVQSEMDKVFEKLDIEREQQHALDSMVRSSLKAYGNAGAFDVLIPNAEASKMFSGSAVMRTDEPDQVLSSIQETIDSLQKEPVQDLMEELGLKQTMTLQKSVRQYKEVDIHHMQVEQDFEGMGPEAEQAMMQWKDLMGKQDYDLAIVGNRVLYAFGSQSIETLVDAVKNGSATDGQPLESAAEFGAGSSAYLDLDIAAIFNMMIPVMSMGAANSQQSADAFQMVTSILKDAPKLTMAADIQEAKAECQMMVPASLIGKIAQAGTMMQMVMMQQQGAQGQPAPGQPAPGAPAPGGNQ